MRKFQSTILITIMLLLQLTAFAQAPATCNLTGTVYNPDGTLAVAVQFRVSKISKNGALISQGPFVYTTDSNGIIRDTSNNAGITLPQGSAAYVYSTVPPWNVTGGVPINVPNTSSAALASLATVAAVPVTGATVQTGSGPTTLTNKEGTFWFTSGLKATETSPGIAKIEIDSTTLGSFLPTVTANRALQSNGSGQTAASSVTNTELGYLSGVTSAIQTQINAKGDASTNTASSVDSEIALFSGTGGKTLKRATGSGVAHLASGVLSAGNVNLASEVTGQLPVANGTNFVDVLNSQNVAGAKTFTGVPILLAVPAGEGTLGNSSVANMIRGADGSVASPQTGNTPSLYYKTVRSGGTRNSAMFGFNFVYNQQGLSQADTYGFNYRSTIASDLTGGTTGGNYWHQGARTYVTFSPTNIPSGSVFTGYAAWDEGERTTSGISLFTRQIDVYNNTASDAAASTTSADKTSVLASYIGGDPAVTNSGAHNTMLWYVQGHKRTSAYWGLVPVADSIVQTPLNFTLNTATLQGTWSATNGSATVSGSGGHADVEAVAGDWLLINSTYARVSSATANSITLTANFSGSTGSGLTITKSVQPIWMPNNAAIMALNGAGSARKALVRLSNSDIWEFDGDSLGSNFNGQVKVTKTNSIDAIANAHLLLENTAGNSSEIYFTFNNTTKSTIRGDSGGNLVFNSVGNNFYWNQDYGSGAPTFNSALGAINFIDGLKSALGTITSQKPALDLSATWNQGSTVFTLLKANATDTTSAATSLLFDFQKAGVSQISGDKNGNLTITGVLKAGSGPTTITNSTGLVLDAAIVSALTGKTYNGLTVSTSTGTLTISNGKTASISNTLTFTGTDGSSIAFGAGGTIGGVGYSANGQIAATATNDDAAAGKVGEVISSNIASGSAITLTNNVAANLTSVSLTAGDWDVWVFAYFVPGGTVSALDVSVSTTSASVDFTNGSFSQVAYANPSTTQSQSVGPTRVKLTGTTTVYGVVAASFGTSMTCYGLVRARRVR